MIAWTIAGSDSGGGAGIQTDLKTFQSFGVHGCSVVTALTAQNSLGVSKVQAVDPTMIQAQLDALSADLKPSAVKLGMLGSSSCLDAILPTLKDLDCPIICDPVLAASSGDALADETYPQALVETLFPHIDLLTPNLIEAQRLTGLEIAHETDVIAAAQALHRLGVSAVLIKGGHSEGPYSQDYFSDGESRFWLTAPRIQTIHGHGTGCTLSSAIAAAMALGYTMSDALVLARTYLQRGLAEAVGFGAGPGPLAHGGWPEGPEHLPWITQTPADGRNRLTFPSCGPEPLGLYPLFDSVAWMERLLPLGIRTVQLRIKDGATPPIQAIQAAVTLAEQWGCRLFVNDYWREALDSNAYGVHLGQEDLPGADLKRLANAGIRLGVSTHTYTELAIAVALQPSYIAYGPIFTTLSKETGFSPRGLKNLHCWRKLVASPLVAIGGIDLKRAKTVLEQGADSLALIAAITSAEDPERAVKQWISVF